MKKSPLSLLIDLLFPRFCVQCNQQGSYFCANCANSIKLKRDIEQTNPDLDQLIVALNYKNPNVRKLLKLFKYSFARELGKPLSQILYRRAKNVLTGKLISYVPLHPKRQHWRSFNQSRVLADGLGFALSQRDAGDDRAGCVGLLEKVRDTCPQAGLLRRKRLENLKGAFRVLDSDLVLGREIVLVDDVSTTGATLSECAHVLKEAGAACVIGLVVAKN